MPIPRIHFQGAIMIHEFVDEAEPWVPVLIEQRIHRAPIQGLQFSSRRIVSICVVVRMMTIQTPSMRAPGNGRAPAPR